MPERNRLKRLLPATVLAAAMVGTATAQMPGIGTGGTEPGSDSSSGQAPAGASAGGSEFQKLDKNKDGTIDKKEASRNKDLKSKWSSLDADKNDKLDQAEFAQFEAQQGSGEESSPQSSPPAGQERPSSPMLP